MYTIAGVVQSWSYTPARRVQGTNPFWAWNLDLLHKILSFQSKNILNIANLRENLKKSDSTSENYCSFLIVNLNNGFSAAKEMNSEYILYFITM